MLGQNILGLSEMKQYYKTNCKSLDFIFCILGKSSVKASVSICSATCLNEFLMNI